MRSLLFLLFSFTLSQAFATDELSLTDKRKIEVEFHGNMAASGILRLSAIEKNFASLAIEQRDVALLAAAGAVNAKMDEWGKKKLGAGEMTQREFTYIFSTAISRLAILAQAVGLNAAAMCHFKEAKALSIMSEGGQGEAANCRLDVYGAETQYRATKLEFTDVAPKIRALANEWATEAIKYSHHFGKADNFGNGPKATVKVKTSDDSISVRRNFEAADESGKIAICAPIFSKMAMMVEIGLDKKRQDGKAISLDNANSLYQMAYRAELFENIARSKTSALLDKAWKDSAADKSLHSSEALYKFSGPCFDLAQKVMTSPTVDQNAVAKASSKAKGRAIRFTN